MTRVILELLRLVGRDGIFCLGLGCESIWVLVFRCLPLGVGNE